MVGVDQRPDHADEAEHQPRVTLMDNNNGSAVVGPDYWFTYQNTTAAPTCGMAYSGTCTNYRLGRLARVGVETTVGVFDWFEYAYDPDGRVRGELYPDGRETSFDYENTGGRFVRVRFPAVSGATVQNFARFDYDNVANEQHREILTSIAHEYTPGTTAFNWATQMQADAAGRITRAQLLDQTAGFHAQRSFRTDGRVASTSVRYQTGALTMAFAMDRTYSYSSDGSSMGWSTGTTNDVARTLFYDMSNRLVCATSVAGSTTCPTTNTAPFLEAFTYDATDSRLTYRDSTGTTTYAFNGVAMTQEDPPGSYDRTMCR